MSSAAASTVTETIAFSGSPSDYGTSVIGTVFDPALGTLTGVTLTTSGTYDPDVFVGSSSVPTASLLDVNLTTYGPGGGIITFPQGSYTLVQQTNGYLTGPAETFSATTTITNALALSEIYTASGPYGSTDFADVNVFSKPGTPGAWGQADDVSLFSGDLVVTFTYNPIAEPASLSVLGVGGFLAFLLGRHRSRRVDALIGLRTLAEGFA